MGGLAKLIFMPVLTWLGRLIAWVTGADLLALVFRYFMSIACGLAGFSAVLALLPAAVGLVSINSMINHLPPAALYFMRITAVSSGVALILSVYVIKWLMKVVSQACTSFLSSQVGPPKP